MQKIHPISAPRVALTAVLTTLRVKLLLCNRSLLAVISLSAHALAN